MTGAATRCGGGVYPLRTPSGRRGSRGRCGPNFELPGRSYGIFPPPMFGAAKDLMTSKAARAYANNFIQRYGSVDDLTIDSKRNRIKVTVRLNGEVSPVGVTIEKYRVEEEGGKKYFQVLDSSCTLPWLQAVMRDHLHGRRVELPPWAAAAL